MTTPTPTPPAPALPVRKHQRWTDDTRLAFLLALRLHGTVEAASAAIGRMTGVVYDQRGKHPAFAAAWDSVLAERIAAERAARAVVMSGGATGAAGDTLPDASLIVADGRKRRARWDGFSPVRRRHFLRVLSETGEAAQACRAVRLSQGAARRYRDADADFAAAWDRALRVSTPVLEQVAYERAVEGWEEPVFAGGKQIGTRRRHAPQLLKQMIDRREKAAALADDPRALRERAEEAARAAGGFFVTPATREETNASILQKLDMIERRERRAQVREAERLLALGLIP